LVSNAVCRHPDLPGLNEGNPVLPDRVVQGPHLRKRPQCILKSCLLLIVTTLFHYYCMRTIDAYKYPLYNQETVACASLISKVKDFDVSLGLMTCKRFVLK